MNVPTENILVIKRDLFDRLGSFHGLNFEPDHYLETILARGNNFFLARSAAENDPAHKQIIPYVLIAHDGRVLHYVRGKKAGEQRLVAKGSIGIGGHLNDSDESLFAWDEAAYRAGVEREVNEEIKIDGEIFVDLGDERQALTKPTVGALNFKFHHCAEGGRVVVAGDIVFEDVEAAKVFEREVDASLGVIDADVLPEVGELQGGAGEVGKLLTA